MLGELWTRPCLPRGVLGDMSGNICFTRGDSAWEALQRLLGKGILVSIRARDRQVGLGYSWWKGPHGGDSRDQGLGWGALGLLLQLPCGRK